MKNNLSFCKPGFLALLIYIPFVSAGQSGPGGVGKADGTSTLRYWINALVRFDGAGDKVNTNLSINAGTFPNLTVIAVYVTRIDNCGGVWGADPFSLTINGMPSFSASTVN